MLSWWEATRSWRSILSRIIPASHYSTVISSCTWISASWHSSTTHRRELLAPCLRNSPYISAVGRTPPSAPNPLVRLSEALTTEAGEGVGRSPGGPPHIRTYSANFRDTTLALTPGSVLLFLVLTLLLWFPMPARAAAGGSISGTVKDHSGAVVPKATVTATN